MGMTNVSLLRSARMTRTRSRRNEEIGGEATHTLIGGSGSRGEKYSEVRSVCVCVCVCEGGGGCLGTECDSPYVLLRGSMNI